MENSCPDISKHADLMDSIYRYQRHFYDATRKYILQGRDLLIRTMDLKPGDLVLEAGCGTGRNLMALSRRYPQARLFGLDLSGEMLCTARSKVAKNGAGNIGLVQCGAESYHYRDTFGLDRPFDAIFFSYSLSMIPPWRQALDTALANLRDGGSLYVVDFWDLGGYPMAARVGIKWWLGLFHVIPEPKQIDYLEELSGKVHGRLTLHSIKRRYAYVAELSGVTQ